MGFPLIRSRENHGLFSTINDKISMRLKENKLTREELIEIPAYMTTGNHAALYSPQHTYIKTQNQRQFQIEH